MRKKVKETVVENGTGIRPLSRFNSRGHGKCFSVLS